MPADQPNRPAKPSWRGGAQPAGRPAGPKAWTQAPSAGPQRAKFYHRLKIAGWFCLLAGLLIAFVVYLFFRPVRTPVVAVVGTRYEAPLPPNAWAKEDVQRLLTPRNRERLFSKESKQITWESKEQGLLELRRTLDSLQPGGPKRDVIIVYLSMHGAVAAIDGKEEPVLLPPGVSCSDSTQWLPVRELFQKLFVDDNRLRDVTKFVILDCTRMDVNWRLGLLYNGFAERLAAVVDEMRIPRLVVLNSTSAGQVGWADAELEGSVFGRFVEQGLAGAAASKGDRITARQLHQYVQAKVRGWVLENRDDIQEPMLLCAETDADHPLIHRVAAAQGGESQDLQAAAATDSRWETIDELWERHRELRQKYVRPSEDRAGEVAAKSVVGLHPLAWEEFQQALLRLEQLVSAGSAYKDDFAETAKTAGDLLGQLAHDAPPPDLAAYSLPLARQFYPGELEKDRGHLPVPWKKPAKPAAAEKPAATKPAGSEKPAGEKAGPDKPGEKPAGAKPAGEKPAGEKPASESEPEPVSAYSYLAAAAESWEWFATAPIAERERLPAVLRFVERGERRLRTDVIEVHFLRMLDAYLDWKSPAAEHVPAALRAVAAAERAAAPADERVQYWVDDLIGRADQSRRRAEDGMFIGSPQALRDSVARWNEAAGEDGRGGLYRDAANLAHQLSAALALRDCAMADGPHLAAWLMARHHRSTEPQLEDLEQLLADTWSLGRELEHPLQGGRVSDGLQRVQSRVQEKLSTLEKAFDLECEQLRTMRGADRKTLRDIGVVLSTPLATGGLRRSLRQRFGELVPGGSSAPDAAAAGDPADPAAKARLDALSGEAARFMERLGAWNPHPAMALAARAQAEGVAGQEALDRPAKRGKPAAADPDPAQREAGRMALATQGEHIRKLLGQAPVVAARMAGTPSETRGGTAAREGRSRADRLVRSSAALLSHTSWKAVAQDPTHQLRLFDLSQRCLGQCRRALDAFWGPAPGGDKGFFQVAAGHYLDSARELSGEARPELGGVDLQDLLQRRTKAAEAAFLLKVPDIKEADPLAAEIARKITVTQAADLPPGEAALFVQAAGERQPFRVRVADQRDLRRMTLPVPGAARSEERDYAILKESYPAGPSRLEEVVFYRAHLFRKRFDFEFQGDVPAITFSRLAPPAPRITVSGQATQRDTIVFVFDCSASMSERDEADKIQSPRLDRARSAFLNILERLVDPDNPYRVGLFLYGHRSRGSGWPGEETGKIIMRPANLPPIHPSDDIERVLELDDFTRERLDAVRQRLEKLEPWGETPLYRALSEAIDELRLRGRAGQRRIVAITDGLDNPGLNLRGPVPPKGGISGKDVGDKLAEQRDIRVDILGFSIKADDRDKQASLANLERIATANRGQLHPVADSTALRRELEKSLDLDQYLVTPAQGPADPAARSIPLNHSWPLESLPRKTAFVVRLVDPDRPAQSEVTVENGDGLELFVKDLPNLRERKLIHHRYSKDDRDVRENLADPLDPKRKFFVAAHLARWQGKAVQFLFSVQNADPEGFSPRPAEVFVHVRPLQDDAAPPARYTFYDMEFVPARPVPVLRCVAPAWPPEAKRAELRVWFKMAKTVPDQTLRVGQLERTPISVPSIPGVTFEMETRRGSGPNDPYQLLLTERHTDAEVDSVKVEMDPMPKEVQHRFNPKSGTVRHTFLFDDAEIARIGDYRIHLTSRKRLAEQAVSVDPPLITTIER